MSFQNIGKHLELRPRVRESLVHDPAEDCRTRQLEKVDVTVDDPLGSPKEAQGNDRCMNQEFLFYLRLLMEFTRVRTWCVRVYRADDVSPMF